MGGFKHGGPLGFLVKLLASGVSGAGCTRWLDVSSTDVPSVRLMDVHSAGPHSTLASVTLACLMLPSILS